MDKIVHRKLSAIIAADVVGYSRLMSADEAGTLHALRRLRSEVLGPVVAGHRGKIIKSMGDGWLIQFSSAVDAVNCAMQVQERLTEGPKICMRVGVHIGDVVHEDDDVFGAGVNIAARLQEIAEPGGVAISDAVYGVLDGTLRPSFDDCGERALKNIERPIRVWVRTASIADRADMRSVEPAASRRPGFPRLVIRPVSTSDERADVRELADALTSDLDAYLRAVRWLLAETADRVPDASYFLRSLLRASGDRLRLEARLFASGGEQLWLGKFGGSLSESFEWQDRVGEEIVANLLGLVMDCENRKLAGLTPHEMTAEQCLLAGMMSFRAGTVESYAGALDRYAKALEKDPDLVEANAEAIFMTIGISTLGHSDIVAPYLERCSGWVEHARPLARESAALEVAIGLYDYSQKQDPVALRAKVIDMLRRAPFDTRVLIFGGWALLWSGDPELALDCFRKHSRMGKFDAYPVVVAAGAAIACVQIGDDAAAIAYARRGVAVTTGYAALYRALAAAYAHLGNQEEAIAALADVLRLVPTDSVSFLRSRNRAPDTPGWRRFVDGLRKAGLPE